MKRYKLPIFLAVLLALAGSTYAVDTHSVLTQTVQGNRVTNVSGDDSPKFIVPEQEILGDEDPVALGDLVSLSVSRIEKHPNYHVSCSYTWTLIDLSNGDNKSHISTDDGVFFGAGISEKTIRAICAVTHVYIVPGETKGTCKEIVTKTVMLEGNVRIGGSNPTPPTPTPPGPGPAPTPAPDLPDGKFGLAKTVYSLVNEAAPADTRVAGAHAMATAMRGIASSIAAGVLKKPEDVLKTTTNSNRLAMTNVGVDYNTWNAYSSKLETVLFDLYETEKLNTLEDYQTAWNEIATGLEAVK